MDVSKLFGIIANGIEIIGPAWIINLCRSFLWKGGEYSENVVEVLRVALEYGFQTLLSFH